MLRLMKMLMALGVALVPLAGQAAPVLYECDVTPSSRQTLRPGTSGWVSDKLMVVIDNNGKGQVIDNVIYNFYKKPIEASLSARNNKIIASWRLKNAKDSDQLNVPAFNYSAVITKDTGEVRVTARPSGSSQSWSGKGVCKLRQNATFPKSLR